MGEEQAAFAGIADRRDMKRITLSEHALERIEERGTTKEEVEKSIREGEAAPAKLGRLAFRKNFSFESEWKGKYYAMKQVMPVVVEIDEELVVVTVYVFYFGG